MFASLFNHTPTTAPDSGAAVSCAALNAHASFEIAFVLVRLDHVSNVIVNANHSIMRTAVMRCVSDCVVYRTWPVIPHPTEREHVGNEINAAATC